MKTTLLAIAIVTGVVALVMAAALFEIVLYIFFALFALACLCALVYIVNGMLDEWLE